jgi:hypothetical protein
MLPIPPFISWNSRIKLLRGIKDDFWPPDMLLEVWTHTLQKPLHLFFWRCSEGVLSSAPLFHRRIC